VKFIDEVLEALVDAPWPVDLESHVCVCDRIKALFDRACDSFEEACEAVNEEL
jgi:hypothetical protein